LFSPFRDAACIFYLVLRALDTVEDDMTIPLDVKVPMLKTFYKNLQDPEWRFMDSNEKDKIVLEQFPQVC
jgi:farnesyl-diphosphate farnesyltransferase